MTSNRSVWIALIFVAASLLIAANFMSATCQPAETVQPSFTGALAAVREAEAAGARSDELTEIVALLNKALEINQEAVKLTQPDQAGRRAELLRESDQLVGTVEVRAAELAAVASQRTYWNTVLAYVSGGVVAALATVAYAYGTSLWRKYRIKRTLQMRVIPK